MKIKDTKPTGGVFRTIKTDQYFTIKNEVFNREDLSWAAMGVLGYILSKPNGWTVRTGDLINRSKSKGIGKYVVQNIINELKEKGYMRRFVVRDEEGKLTWVTETYESIELNPYYNPITQLVEYPQDGISTNEVEYKLTEEVVNTDKEINTEVAQLSQIDTQGETMDNQDEMDKQGNGQHKLTLSQGKAITEWLGHASYTIGAIKHTSNATSVWITDTNSNALYLVVFRNLDNQIIRVSQWLENKLFVVAEELEGENGTVVFVDNRESSKNGQGESATTTTNAQGDYLPVTPAQLAQANDGKGKGDIANIPSVFGQVELLPDEKDALIARLLRENAELKQGKVSHVVQDGQPSGEPEKVSEPITIANPVKPLPENEWTAMLGLVAKDTQVNGRTYDDTYGQPVIAATNDSHDHSVDTNRLIPDHIGNANKMVTTTAVSGVDLASGQDKTAIATYHDGQLIDSVVLPNEVAKQYLQSHVSPLSFGTVPPTPVVSWVYSLPELENLVGILLARQYPSGLTDLKSPQWTHSRLMSILGSVNVTGDRKEMTRLVEFLRNNIDQTNANIVESVRASMNATTTPRQQAMGFATPAPKDTETVDSAPEGTKRTIGQNKPKLSDDKTVRELHEGAMELAHEAIAVQAGFVKAESFHDQAMVIADDAFLAQKQQKDIALAKELFSKATILETKAARQLPAVAESEPSRSILYRSAASLAYNAEEYKTAEKLANEGLRGYPSPKIKDELLSLRSDIKKALASLKPPKVNLAQDFLKRWCEEVLCYGKRDESTGVYEKATYAISWAMEMKGVKTLLANGRTFDENYADARAHYHYLKQQAYWQDKHISIQAVAKDLNAWIQRGRPTEQPRPQWQVDKAQKAQLQDESKALWDELVTFTGGMDSSGTKRPLRYGRDRGKVAKSLMSKGLLAVVEKMSASGAYSSIIDMSEEQMKFAFLNAVKKLA